ncbi:phosphotransferase [Agromyces sp. SYSU K20354]|uniref:phosphotransferase n=1 Tax=Agromyces cavernae TaxID=2898659 RepID=UPI001E618B9A|nr:phosphotransferase [Agromyces cavernae]MCD2444355.1 phosphotransferase [Agromyces cavernae]
MQEHEHALTGGNATQGVVRVGATVRKPWTPATAGVLEFMGAVRSAGVDVPEPLGQDELGRQVTEFVPGRLALELPSLSPADLARVGQIVRAIHDASEGFVPRAFAAWDTLIPAPDDELVCHNDLAPWNLIVGDRWVFIDWDGAGPSTRLWDLAYAAQAFTLSDASEDPKVAAERLKAFVDGYGATTELRSELPSTMARRAEAMYDLLHASHRSGREPWGSMYVNGHGAHWRVAADYVQRSQSTWLEALTARVP